MNTAKVIATDLDGTLFYPRKRIKMIPSDSRKFLERFIDDGGRLVIVSGRNRYFGEKVERNLKRHVDVVGCNGAFVTCNGMVIQEKCFPTDELKQMLKEVRREYHFMVASLFCRHRNFVIDSGIMNWRTLLGYRMYQFMQGVYREPVQISDKLFYEELEKGEVYKVLLITGIMPKYKEIARQITETLTKTYPNMVFAWSDQAIEITPKGCSKSSGLAFYLDYNKISSDNILVVGDSGNDISMFQAFQPTSFCMAHSSPDVQKHAAHIIQRFSDLKEYIYPSVEKNNPLD